MNDLLVALDSYVIIRWLFLRFFGLIYLIAFTSIGVQITGLIGEKGVLPAGQFLKRIKHGIGTRGFFLYPTLVWFSATDNMLRGICLFGAFLSLLLIVGIQTTPVLFLLWLLYLSVVVAGQVFLSFQWDVLLVEAGFMAIFLVPQSLPPSQALAPPSRLVIFLFIWLLFRLNFMSGLLKLTSGDPTWRGLTAMSYHYETQPLPTPLAWYFHQAPLFFQKISTFIAVSLEISAPLLFFSTRSISTNWRRWDCYPAAAHFTDGQLCFL